MKIEFDYERLADLIAERLQGSESKEKAQKVETPAKAKKEPEKEKEAPEIKEEVKQDMPKIALEDVRGYLAKLSQQGKQSEVKALIQKYGGAKLTDIDPDQFYFLMEEAEKL